MAQVDVGYKGPDENPARGGSHELGGGESIVPTLGGENGVKACLFGFPSNLLNFLSVPICSMDNC
jgi:hypothetical protein